MTRDLRAMYEEIYRTYPDLLAVRHVQEILGASRELTLKILRANHIPHIMLGKCRNTVAKRYIIDYLLREMPDAPARPGGREVYTELFGNCPEMITTRQMQHVLGIGRNLMYRMIRENEIPHVWVSERKLFIPKRPLIDYLVEHEVVEA